LAKRYLKADKGKIEGSKLRQILEFCDIEFEESVFSVHRHRSELEKYCQEAMKRGVIVFIVGAGRAAHLAGAVATLTNYSIPVLAVAISSTAYPNAADAVFSISRMPEGCPVLFVEIDAVGFTNAAIVACQIIGTRRDMAGQAILKKLAEYRQKETDPSEQAYNSWKRKEEDDGSSSGD